MRALVVVLGLVFAGVLMSQALLGGSGPKLAETGHWLELPAPEPRTPPDPEPESVPPPSHEAGAPEEPAPARPVPGVSSEPSLIATAPDPKADHPVVPELPASGDEPEIAANRGGKKSGDRGGVMAAPTIAAVRSAATRTLGPDERAQLIRRMLALHEAARGAR